MHLLAQSVILRVRQAIGDRFDFVAAFDHIRKLDDLARAIDAPGLADRASILDAPVIVGGVAFYRLSFAAGELISDRFDVFSGRVYDMAVAWASAHARDVEATRRMFGLSEADAEAEVLRWARTVSASFRAVVETVNHLVAPIATEEPAKDSADGAGFGSIVALLVRECGHDATHWCFASTTDVVQALEGIARKHDVGREPGQPPSPNSYAAKSQIRFNRAAKEFEVWAKEKWPHE